VIAPYFAEFPVRFNDIDAAGIVYFPRLLHFCHCALEDFVTDRSPRSYRRYVLDGLGFPVIRVEGGFFERVHYLDRLRVGVACEEIRTHAFRMRYDLAAVPGEGGGVPRPSARIVLVHAVTRLADFALQDVPHDLREALASVREPAPPAGPGAGGTTGSA
jgi:4-hydroxybenzoyl-CoA thioesterase